MADNPLVRPIGHDSDCPEPCQAKWRPSWWLNQ